MNAQIKPLVEFFADRIYQIQFVDIPNGTRNSAVDRDARIISDFLATGQTKVTHSTYFILKHTKLWSEGAIKVYETLSGNHNARCSTRLNGSRFTIEHEYPLGILKQMVQDKQFKSPSEVVDYMNQYGVPVIVTLEEDAKLRGICRTALSLKEAEDRYKKAGIIIKKFDGVSNDV
jgi:hypothetical protein